MKKTLSVAMVFLLGIGTIGDALADRVHYRSRVGVGVVIGPYWGPWYYPPHPYYYPPYYPPVVIEQPAPPVYIEQQPMETATPSGYWYYCQSPEGYYPDVRECPGGWLKVLPRPQSGR